MRALTRSQRDLAQSTRVTIDTRSDLVVSTRPIWMKYVWLLVLVIVCFKSYEWLIMPNYSSLGDFIHKNLSGIETWGNVNDLLWRNLKRFFTSITGLGLVVLLSLIYTQIETCHMSVKKQKIFVRRRGFGKSVMIIPFDDVEGVEVQVNRAYHSDELTRVVLVLKSDARVPVHTAFNHSSEESNKIRKQILHCLGKI